ncbi:Subtilase family protein [Paracoccus chinensis]|uniref:Subtilase family protein n=2 Tax=Paracoccus chinensis TaxID=525640 RepID=A0A1G9JWB8_9RHOB|nr:Subtilase family protein [Paracoccus chinensis]
MPAPDSDEPGPYVVELNAQHRGGLPGAENDFFALFRTCVQEPAERDTPSRDFKRWPVRIGKSYYRCELLDDEWRRLVAEDERKLAPERAIFRLWPDFVVRAYTDRSVATIKADAALNSFGAAGEDITWAVVDSGIDVNHPHFGDASTPGGRASHLLLNDAVRDLHRNFADLFTGTGDDRMPIRPLASPDEDADLAPEIREVRIEEHRQAALSDDFGHGTHVAGIIAGQAPAPERAAIRLLERQFTVNESGKAVTSTFTERQFRPQAVSRRGAVAPGRHEPRGMAPLCRLISLRVLDDRGEGRSSQVIQALEYLRERINDNPKVMRVHGVNLSVGYSFDPEVFACGQSPLCTTVNRLVQEGVVVVTAAGNTGYGSAAASTGSAQVGISNSINDPGNADLAITVGATHRDAPHTYGVSYFSSKGPTTDGRLKPDLVAPGERITSCAAGKKLEAAGGARDGAAHYLDDTGTSMAAPHVSGAIAAFLSIRREFIGRPLDVKRIFLESATPLGRERYFEGHGLVDLMRAIQSV